MKSIKGFSKKGFNNFITDIVAQFNVTSEEVLNAMKQFGDFRAKVYTYFVVRSYQQRMGLPVETEKDSVVNRWYASY